MERLRQLISHINAQLSLLTGSQRLAIGLCAALAVVSLLWLMQWSTSPPMVPLVTREFTYDQLDAAEEGLRANGIKFETRGTRVFVPAAQRHNAQRVLYTKGALPEGSLFDMEAVVSDSNPFQSPEARQYAQNFAKGNELAKIIATSPYVDSASVIINPITKRRLGGITDTPTASVSVMLRGGMEMEHSMVEGFAKLVAGAVAGLKPHGVSIIDARTLRPYSLPHPDDAASYDVFSMVKRREDHFRKKILSKLADIPGLQVEVTVELDTSKRIIQNVKHAKPALKKEETDATDQSTGSGAAEPGVSANIGQALTGAGSGQSNTMEKTVTENFEPKLTQTETIEQMPFTTKNVTASVGIPRSFIASIYKNQYPDATEDPKDVDPDFINVRDAQTERVRRSVALIVMARSPNDVEVDVYPDMEWTAGGGVWNRSPGGVARGQQAVAGSDTLGLVRTYGPQVGLAGLALASLMLMTRTVRKSTELMNPRKRDSAQARANLEEEEVLTVGPTAIGQAEVSEALLAGQEVDTEALRYQELGTEVSKMVEGDPEGTAELIRRWVDENQ